MATSQFRNLDTDTTLGGNSPSDYTVSSQKAIKTYVDNQIPTVNNATLTITQGGVSKGTFTANAGTDVTIALDAGGGGGGLPDQTGHAGEFLTTDGTDASWSDAIGYHPDLFDHKWADHILDDVQWLRADTFSWQSGAVYQAAYQHLADDITGKTLQSETISGITIQFYLADDGHKICPASEESNVASIYAATGVAWYYILDTTNQRFKLPRVSPDKANVLDTAPVSVGVYGDGNKLMLRRTSDGATGGLICYAAGNPNNSLFTNEFSAYNGTVGISTDPTNSGLIGSGTMTTNGATTYYSGKKYLYFYVGNFTQTALENTAGLNASLFNAKADIDLSNAALNASTSAKETINGWLMPDYSAGTSLTFTDLNTATEAGFFEIWGTAYNNTHLTIELNGVSKKLAQSNNNSYSTCGFAIIPVSAGDTVKGTSSYSNSGTITFYPCKK